MNAGNEGEWRVNERERFVELNNPKKANTKSGNNASKEQKHERTDGWIDGRTKEPKFKNTLMPPKENFIHLRVPRFGADKRPRPHTLTPVGKQGLPSLSLPAETKLEISDLWLQVL